MNAFDIDYLLGRTLVFNGARWLVLRIRPADDRLWAMEKPPGQLRGEFEWSVVRGLIEKGDISVE